MTNQIIIFSNMTGSSKLVVPKCQGKKMSPVQDSYGIRYIAETRMFSLTLLSRLMVLPWILRMH